VFVEGRGGEGWGGQGTKIQKVYNEQSVEAANYRSELCGVVITNSVGKRGGKHDTATLQERRAVLPHTGERQSYTKWQ
jgi:hypothetical protein